MGLIGFAGLILVLGLVLGAALLVVPIILLAKFIYGIYTSHKNNTEFKKTDLIGTFLIIVGFLIFGAYVVINNQVVLSTRREQFSQLPIGLYRPSDIDFKIELPNVLYKSIYTFRSDPIMCKENDSVKKCTIVDLKEATKSAFLQRYPGTCFQKPLGKTSLSANNYSKECTSSISPGGKQYYLKKSCFGTDCSYELTGIVDNTVVGISAEDSVTEKGNEVTNSKGTSDKKLLIDIFDKLVRVDESYFMNHYHETIY